MEVFRVCVVSGDISFAQKMAEYFMKKSRVLLQVEIRKDFFRPEQNVEPDVLLVDSEWNQEEVERLLEKGEISCRAGVICLSDLASGINRVRLKYYRVSRYLSCRALLELIERICLKSETGEAMKEAKGMVIGVYSPVGRCGKTSFSICMAQILGKKWKTLFVTVDHYLEWFQDSGNIAGLVFDLSRYEVFGKKKDPYLQVQEGDFLNLEEPASDDTGGMSFFRKYAREKEGITYIPLPQRDSDLYDITAAKLANVVRELKKEVEILILDFSGLVGPPWALVDMCDYLFIPGMHDSWSSKRVELFREQLKRRDFEEEADGFAEGKKKKTCLMEVVLPTGINSPSADNYYAELKWSPMGIRTTEILRECGIL